MRTRRSLSALFGAATLVLGLTAAASAAPSAVADGKPCGYFATSKDSFYNHCTGDGSNVVIKVDAVLAPDYDTCVTPGTSWLGPRSKVRNAWYAGRTC
ncbi:DUF6355 family natural product biosynthesis protein [Streptomyces sp. NBC_01465]|uniref:DUF6355 family natural product biosynthesis protein n=1 Tax=Streptomyces sp. NBC_01465 TaxID=2903878 RepID=UPI002E335F4F|nr:DUF6355 family natural product biosynthesis protein [Streptomyces sp. NBC_01465]